MAPRHPPRSDSLVLNGLAHHLWRWDGDGPGSLVLLHGYLDVARSFVPFVDALAEARGDARALPPVFAPDLRGHGRTARVGAGGYYHFADYVADVAALVESLPPPVVLVGHSMGGTIASLFAGTFPEKVSALVLVEGLGPASHRDDTAPERMATWIREVDAVRRRTTKPMASLDDVAQRLRAANPRLEMAQAADLAPFASRPVDGGFTWAFDPLHRTKSPAPFDVATYRLFLRRITCPTLLVEGGESPFRAFIDDDRASEVAALTRVVIPGASHMLHQEAPAELARHVASFLGWGSP